MIPQGCTVGGQLFESRSGQLFGYRKQEKQATAEMMLHNQYQKQMVETISEGFMAIDKDGRIAYLVSPEKVGVF